MPKIDKELVPNDSGTRYIYQESTTATGNFVAAMARAARVFKPFDSTFASTCLAAAVKGWQYLQAHPGIIPSPSGFHNPPGSSTGEYGDGTDSDERLWAAAELFAATGKQEYDDYFKANMVPIAGPSSWRDVRTMAEQLSYTSAGRRFMTVSTFEEITKSEPEKSLIEPLFTALGYDMTDPRECRPEHREEGLALAPDAPALTQLLREFLDGASRNDVATHERFWADELIYTRAIGQRVSKADILKEIKNEAASTPKPTEPESSTFSAEDIRVLQYGATAVVAFRLVGKTNKTGKTETANYFNTGTFVKRDGKWQAVAWQATKIPEDADQKK